ncbi:MAG: DUF2220 domain-containing protein [Oscillospiraceae bacterium]|nr:DUF2220 domain-containing protein [Oscillospiraceae bacterium]
MERGVILNRLLDKYENSKHLSSPNTSNRRVMLRIDKKELPEYNYESSESRDRYNKAARELESEGIIKVESLKDRPIMTALVLNLQETDKAYKEAKRKHPAQTAEEFLDLVEKMLSSISTPWIIAWRDDVCETTQKSLRLPSFAREGLDYVRSFFYMLVVYDRLKDSSISLRSFSISCFQNSKSFELEYMDEFLRAATRYHPDIEELSQQEEIGPRDKLALLGIYSQPELYQLSGRCEIIMEKGNVNISPLINSGFALSSTSIYEIKSFDLSLIKYITFIENLTNYNEYIRNEIDDRELVVYHGGFISPRKRQFLNLLAQSMQRDNIDVYFWADIDLGGFRMFYKLEKIFPKLRPMRMLAIDVTIHAHQGLVRSEQYLHTLRGVLERNEHPIFNDSIREILKHGVTIEQEVFL